MQNLPQDRIAQLAYQLWQQRGCPAGSPEVDWEQAVQLLENQPQAGNNDVLSVPMATSQQGQPTPDAATSADGTTASAAPIGGGASTMRSRGKGRTLRRSPI